MKKTNYLEELVGLVQQPNQKKKMLKKFDTVFEDIASSLATQNIAKITTYVQFLNVVSESLHSKRKDKHLESLSTRVKEYLFILHIFINKNVNIQLLEQLEEEPFSMLVLESLKRSQQNYEQIKETVFGTEPTEEESLLRQTIDKLQEFSFIEIGEEGYKLAERGRELFSAYSKGKKMTNKYERVRRQQMSSRSVTVNIELLNKIERVQGAFRVLETYYNTNERELPFGTLIEELGEEEGVVLNALVILKKLHLIDTIEEDNTFVLLTSGENVFKTYQRSKRFTNKYEKLKRKKTPA